MLRFSMMISIVIFVWGVNIHVFAENQRTEQQQENCDSPFGDKDTTNASMREMLGRVKDVEFGKNADGSWHIKKCLLSPVYHVRTINGVILLGTVGTEISFKKPYPIHQNLKEKDWVCITTGDPFIDHRGAIRGYTECELYENVTESANRCTVTPPNGRLNGHIEYDPNSYRSRSWMAARDLQRSSGPVELQCVVVALQYLGNPDIGPYHDYDIVISGAVVKCGDGKLYDVQFYSNWLRTEHDKEVIRMPGKGSFGEGDKITMLVKRDMVNLYDDDGEPSWISTYDAQFLKKGWEEVE